MAQVGAHLVPMARTVPHLETEMSRTDALRVRLDIVPLDLELLLVAYVQPAFTLPLGAPVAWMLGAPHATKDTPHPAKQLLGPPLPLARCVLLDTLVLRLMVSVDVMLVHQDFGHSLGKAVKCAHPAPFH